MMTLIEMSNLTLLINLVIIAKIWLKSAKELEINILMTSQYRNKAKIRTIKILLKSNNKIRPNKKIKNLVIQLWHIKSSELKSPRRRKRSKNTMGFHYLISQEVSTSYKTWILKLILV